MLHKALHLHIFRMVLASAGYIAYFIRSRSTLVSLASVQSFFFVM